MLSSRWDSLERRLFSASDVAGLEGAAKSMSARDASDRAAQLRTAEEAADLLRRAEGDGDELLARAVARRSMELADSSPGRDQAALYEGVTRTFVQAAARRG